MSAPETMVVGEEDGLLLRRRNTAPIDMFHESEETRGDASSWRRHDWQRLAFDHSAYQALAERDLNVSEYNQEIEKGAPKAGLLQFGRDFRSIEHVHKFTTSEREKMSKFEGLDYRETNSSVYREHLRSKKAEGSVGKWVIMMLVGLVMGLIAWVLTQSVGFLTHKRLHVVEHLLSDGPDAYGDVALAFLFTLSYNVSLVLLASVPVVFIQPVAAGSGVPEVMAYLNGIRLPKVFNIRTLATKLFSCICAVSSSLPCGPEGPIIHLGAMVGAGVSQGRSRTLRFRSVFWTKFFRRFQNNRDHRDFILAGAAAGVAAAFAAPLGGMLFVMEEISSWWDINLTWMIFFTCLVATVTSDFGNSAFEAFIPTGARWGYFDRNSLVLFNQEEQIPLSLLSFIPAVLLGIVGGLLGVIFTWIQLKVTRFRARRVLKSRLRSIAEPCAIVVLWTALSFALPFVFGCRPVPDPEPDKMVEELELLTCICHEREGHYSPLGTLTYHSGEQFMRHIFSRNTREIFPYDVLVPHLVLYFGFACYTTGTSVAAGLVLPMLSIGGLLGRLTAIGIGNMLDSAGLPTDWVDPGMYAVIGAGAFFGGVCRLTVSLTVIMLEISGVTYHLLPLMSAIMIAKWVGDSFIHPLYHALLEVKCLPFLDQMPALKRLDMWCAKDVMASPVRFLREQCSVRDIVEVLGMTTHNAFPVVSDDGTLKGIITRSHLEVIIAQPETVLRNLGKHSIDYERLMNIKDETFLAARSQKVPELAPGVMDLTLDITAYFNSSPFTVQEGFSLQETYLLFRSLGLRHLVVLSGGKVTGIITRKDLVGHNIDERVTERLSTA
eukprot:TRINITY_DN14025_c0_g1_i2.p1 TRINITY_DN14025_c0_g1~~TRINITY_DN14025_c0_g1_i2.p1  ORF type:complete len:831 (+),score=165.20 TRINITY_DN14025_c0_g1_i2:34-2526(+)